MTRLKIDISSGILEVEGEETFVRAVYEDYRERMTLDIKPQSSSVTSVPPTNDISSLSISKETNRKTTKAKGKSKESYTIVKELDLSSKNGKKNLRDFYKEKLASGGSAMECNAVFVYYLQKIAGINNITFNHVYSCYKDTQVRVPSALRQSLFDTSFRKGWIDTSSFDDMTITTQGENFVEHDLPKLANPPEKVMIKNLEDFINKFDDFSKWDPRKQIDYICYYLINIEKKEVITAKEINIARFNLDLKDYNRTPQYLSEESVVSAKEGKYIKVRTGGYRLERKTSDDIAFIVNNEPSKIQVSNQLLDLIEQVTNSNEKFFLIEAINCYKVRAYRATIVLIWMLTMDHLYTYIFSNKLDEFNNAIISNPDKRLKKIINCDDFIELKDTKFIELARSANIISNDVRKILDEKLGIRNSAAHPSAISFREHKTTEFIMDLLDNIVLKY